MFFFFDRFLETGALSYQELLVLSLHFADDVSLLVVSLPLAFDLPLQRVLLFQEWFQSLLEGSLFLRAALKLPPQTFVLFNFVCGFFQLPAITADDRFCYLECFLVLPVLPAEVLVDVVEAFIDIISFGDESLRLFSILGQLDLDSVQPLVGSSLSFGLFGQFAPKPGSSCSFHFHRLLLIIGLHRQRGHSTLQGRALLATIRRALLRVVSPCFRSLEPPLEVCV